MHGRAPADADDVAVLDDFAEVFGAYLADIFFDVFFVFNGRVGDAGVLEAEGGNDFLARRLWSSMGSKISMRTKPMSFAYWRMRDTDGRDRLSSLAISVWLYPDW